MALPKIKHPIFSIKLKSGKDIKYKPFTIKEEKILLIAKMSKDIIDVIDAVKQIINNCVIGKIDIDTIPTFDIEKLFLAIRSKSVSNIVELKFRDPEDKMEYYVDLNLDDVQVKTPEGHNKIIKVNDSISLQMKYPTYSTLYKLKDSIELMNNIDEDNQDITTEQLMNEIFKIYAECIDKIIDGETIYSADKDFETDEAVEFLHDVPQQTIFDIRNFFQTQPRIEHTVSYTNRQGTVRSYTLKGLSDFFT